MIGTRERKRISPENELRVAAVVGILMFASLTSLALYLQNWPLPSIEKGQNVIHGERIDLSKQFGLPEPEIEEAPIICVPKDHEECS